MRVRISYGADVEDVPEELEQIFSYVMEKSAKVMNQIKQVESCIYDEDLETAFHLIDKTRSGLSKLDARLADIQSIAGGYVEYKKSEGANNVTEGRPSVDPTGNNLAGQTAEQSGSDPNSSEA